jgi:predicted RNase H-like HicB family nuclease
MAGTTKLRIVIFQEGDWLCAHCLEYDFATQAKTLDDLRYDLERMIVGHIAVSLENGLEPFRDAHRAPKKFWTLFNRSKISLSRQSFGLKIKKRGVKIPTPEIRVAPLAA